MLSTPQESRVSSLLHQLFLKFLFWANVLGAKQTFYYIVQERSIYRYKKGEKRSSLRSHKNTQLQ
jgi:hypothetical protein